MSEVRKSEQPERRPAQEIFRRFSHGCARVVGTPLVFGLALAVIVLWAVAGPIFHYSDTWQLAINTGTTVVTFLMVFIIQTRKTGNR